MGDSDLSGSDIEEYACMEIPPLVNQIKSILDQYPDDGQIIKELLQNADDAGATEMNILYNGFTCDVPEPEHERKYSKFFKSPALVVHNNSVFTTSDWRGIKMVYSSLKLDDPLKIGRYGLGFKSVFHITDFPCIISGENVLFINPHETNPSRVCVTIKLQNLHKCKNLNVNDFKRAIIGKFDFVENTLNIGRYDGTLFWFPLRQTQSALSENVYSESKILDLYTAFKADSSKSLLFSKCLQSVKLFVNIPEQSQRCSTDDANKEWNFEEIEHGTITGIYNVHVDNEHGTFHAEKQSFINEISNAIENAEQSLHFTFDVTVTTKIKLKRYEDETAKSRWLIVNYLKGGDIPTNLKLLINDKTLGYSPLVGIAAPMHEDGNYVPGEGHIFCFQPLPQEKHSLTGLTVHVNAFFALSQNRRQIKWPSADQDQYHMHTDKSIQWNTALVSEILPDAYATLCSEMVEISKREGNPHYMIEAVYNLIPNLSTVNDRWTVLVKEFMRLVSGRNIAYTENRHGEWIPIKSAVITPRCHPEASSLQLSDSVTKMLLGDGLDIVHMPNSTKDAFKESIDVKELSPSVLANHLRQTQSYQKQSAKDKENMLTFLTSEPSYSDNVIDLELLPLQNGKFTALRKKTWPTNHVYLASNDVIDVFPGQETKFVSININQCLNNALEDIAKKGMYQLTKLDIDAVVELTRGVSETKCHPKPRHEVGVHTSTNSIVWVENIWKYICKNYSRQIQKFAYIPLFPLTSNMPLSRTTRIPLYPPNSAILVKSYTWHLVPEDVCDAFALMSVAITQSIPDWMDEDVILPYLHYGSTDSIACLLEKVIDDSNIRRFNEMSTDRQKEAFLDFLSRKLGSDLSPKVKKMLSQLVIFKEYTSVNSCHKWTTLENNQNAYKEIKFPINFPTPKLRFGSDSEQRLATSVKAKWYTQVEMIKDTMKKIHWYKDEEVTKFMYWYLKERLYISYPETKVFAMEIKFIAAKNNDMKKACDIFDPSDTLLMDVFQDEPVFPKDKLLHSGDFIIALRSIGMKARTSVTCLDVERVARTIHAKYSKMKKVDSKQISSFGCLLEQLDDETLSRISLSSMKCFKAMQNRPMSFPKTLPFISDTTNDTLYAHNELKSNELVDLIGSVAPVIECSSLPKVAKHFRWFQQPDMDMIVKHLASIVDSFTEESKPMLMPMLSKIYIWLASGETYIRRNVKQALHKQFGLSNHSFIWTGNGFTSPECVCIVMNGNDDIDMQPFIYPLPTELCKLKEFFINLGCQSSITMETYLQTLKMIKNESEKTRPETNVNKMRQMAVSILKKLIQDFKMDNSKADHIIYVPVHTKNKEKLRMEPSTQCTFCDNEWLKESNFTDEDDLLYVHGDLPDSISKALGVNSLTQKILEDADPFDEWGQEEPLTQRINRLITDGYADGFSIAKELFQNADDAGANKLWFLYDKRENEDAKTQLLSGGMKEWQGPAIWVYNDAKFTADDLTNITKLNESKKELDSSKIGKFGQGFCSVYNITDVPSFISGENVVIFDPQTTNLGTALRGKSPGLKINLPKMKSNQAFLSKMGNQFKPFENVFGCKILSEANPNFSGTLFRLPLRKQGSKISNVVYSENEVKQLVDKIIELSSNLFLFNQNVQEIKVFYLPSDEIDPSKQQLVYEVNKSTQCNSSLGKTTFPIIQEAVKLKEARKLKTNPLKVIEKVSISSKLYKESDTYTSREQTVSTESNWLISWATGTQDTSLKLTYANKGAIPLAAISVPIQKDETKGESILKWMSFEDLPETVHRKGHFFCVLPLPIPTHDFPFHIHGTFSVTSDRRAISLASEDDKITKMNNWNEYLLTDSVVEALIDFFANARSLGIVPCDKYYELWPKQADTKLSSWVTKSFYKKLFSSETCNFLESSGSWYCVSKCAFLHPDLKQNEQVCDIALKVLKRFATELHVVDIPLVYYDLLKEANPDVIMKNIVTEETFVLKYFLPNLGYYDQSDYQIKERNMLLQHAIQMQNECVNEWLTHNPCIPTQPNNKLLPPSEVVEKGSEIAEMFVISDEIFPLECFHNDETMSAMRELGMMYDTLSTSLVLDRAKTIEVFNKTCSHCALGRCSVFMNYLAKSSVDHVETVSVLKQGSIRFLPVLECPKQWHCSWKGNDYVNRSKVTKLLTCQEHKDVPIKRYSFEAPFKLSDFKNRYLLGSLFPIFDEEICLKNVNTNVIEQLKVTLGINDPLGDNDSHKVVLRQLECMARTFNPEKSETAEDMSQEMTDIYNYLEQCCKDEEHIQEIHSELKDKKIVYAENCFHLPEDVALEQECPPYLTGLKRSPLADCHRLCNALGIRCTFEPLTIALCLQRIYKQHDGKPLDESELDASLKLLNLLFQNMTKCEPTTMQIDDLICIEKLQAVFVPDETVVLRPASGMCFDDFDSVGKSPNMIFVHGLVPKDVAKLFGVKSKLMQNLEDNSDDIEDFFQEEPLVTRIKSLLDGYPCDTEIFKELLQNADDAGATEIHFLNDRSTHGSEHVFGDSYKPLQGPALCVFNNSSFTKQDLEGIQKLGLGSKNRDPSTTGQYGVGFNAVYNLTDAPSFLTKGVDIEKHETLCIFDPMAKYVPSVSREKPGKRYRNVNGIRQHHNDVLKGYHEEYFTDSSTVTIFRFPLRTNDMAKSSEIKTQPINIDDIDKLLLKFNEELPEMLIFLKHLEKVTISTYESEEFTELYCLDIKLSQSDKAKRKSYFEHLKKTSEAFKQNRSCIFDVPQTIVDYDLTLYDHSGEPIEFLVVQSVGFKCGEKVPDIVKTKMENKTLTVLPQGGVALLLTVPNEKKKTEDIESEQNKNDCEKNVKPRSCKAFCFLPLPIATGLPVHIHGHFALDHGTRRSIWVSDNEAECFKTQWNLTLISQVIAPAYVYLLQERKIGMLGDYYYYYYYKNKIKPSQIVDNALHSYESLFPIDKWTTGVYFKHLMRSVYQLLVSEHIPFLPVIQREVIKFQRKSETIVQIHEQLNWESLCIVDSTVPAYHKQESISDDNAESEFNCILRNIGMRIVQVPLDIRNSMKTSNVKLKGLSPAAVISFMSTDVKKLQECHIDRETNVQKSSLKNATNTKKLLEFCLKDEENFIKEINTIGIFLSQDGLFRHINEEMPLFVTYFNDMFPMANNCFLHITMCSDVFQLIENEKGRLQKHLKKNKAPQLSEKANILQTRLDTLLTGLKTFTVCDCSSFLDKWHSLLGVKRNAVLGEWGRVKPSADWIFDVWTFFWKMTKESKNIADTNTPQIVEEDKFKHIEKSFDLLDEWSIVPVTLNSNKTEHQLIPVKKIRYLINFDSFTGKLITQALTKICKWQLDIDCFKFDEKPKTLKDYMIKDEKKETMGNMVNHISNYKEPDRVLHSLYLNVVDGLDSEITNAEAMAVLQYITDNLDNVSSNKEEIMRLPIFVTHDGERTDLQTCERLFVVPFDMPKDGLDKFTKSRKTVLISEHVLNQKMLNMLSIANSNVEDIYIEYIFHEQFLMERQEFCLHLQYISAKLSRCYRNPRTQSKIVRRLKGLPFVEVKAGQLVTVDRLFDPENKVFKTMCQETELLPTMFRNGALNDLMEWLGLNKTITISLFERFAREISYKMFNDQTTSIMSKFLVSEFFNMPNEFFETNSLREFATIPFIVPDKNQSLCPSIHRQFNEASYISFSDSVVPEKLLICWTTENILPKYCCPTDSKRFFLEKLLVRDKPSPEAFIAHCKNIGTSLGKLIPDVSVNVEDIKVIMTAIYQHFKDLQVTGTIDFHLLKELHEIPLVFYPKQRILRLASTIINECLEHEEIVPYLQKAPVCYGQFHEVFCILGAAQTPLPKLYANVLLTLKEKYTELENSVVIPPDIIAAVTATSNFLVTSQKDEHKCLLEIEQLYLPTSNQGFQHSNCVVISDNMHFRKRLAPHADIHFFEGFECLEPKLFRDDEYIDMFKKLPPSLRPVMLSEIVEEKLEIDDVEVQNTLIERRLNDFMHSGNFVNGILRLSKHAFALRKQDWNETVSDKITKTIKHIQTRQVNEIVTTLTLKCFENGTFGSPKVVEQTKEKTTCHLRQLEDVVYIYFTKHDRDWETQVKRKVIVYVDECIDCCLPKELTFIAEDIFRFENDSDAISDFLDEKRIDPFGTKSDEPVMHKPGTRVPIQYHPFLDNKFSSISVDDYKYMAYLLDDPSLQDDAQLSDMEEETYVFCRIVRAVDDDSYSRLFQNYEIDIGDVLPITVPACKLYKFTNEKMQTDKLTVNINKSDGLALSIAEEATEIDFPEEATQSLRDVYKEIRMSLTEAWTKAESMKRLVVKRLQLRWHPDKNPENADFCTNVFQYIQQCVHKLQHGEVLTDKDDDENAPENDGRRRYQWESPWWDAFFENMRRGPNTRTHRRRDSFDHDDDDSRSSDWCGFSTGHSSTGSSRSRPRGRRPKKYGVFTNVVEARRWQRQASSDISNAKVAVTDLSNHSGNWVCFKCHQAVEKSLKAAWYVKDPNRAEILQKETNLDVISQGLGDELEGLASNMTRLCGGQEKMLYPYCHTGTVIPADVYTEDTNREVYGIADRLLHIVDTMW